VRSDARIVFVTAFDRHALRAFEVNALDYLLKPVSPSASRPASRGCCRRRRPPPRCRRSRGRHGAGRHRCGDRFVPVVEIAAVLSNANYSDVHLRNGQRLFTRRTMKTWAELLPENNFLRVHRHALVNLACVERRARAGREGLELTVTGVRQPVA